MELANALKQKDFERILSMAEIIFSNEKKWDEFFFHMKQQGYSVRGVMEFSMRDIYEIYSMARKLGGSYAKSLIATTSDVQSGKGEINSIYMRMKKMKVGLIEAKEFLKMEASEVFARALQMTE